jgi:hypothetical protein
MRRGTGTRSSGRADGGRGTIAARVGGALAVLGLLASFGVPAAGHVGATAHLPGDPSEVLGEDFERTRNGLFRVELPDGGAIRTHGPDPRRAMNPIDPDGAAPGGATERPPVCATDHYQHVLYAHMAGAPNLLSSHGAAIRTSMRQINSLLNAESLASGGPTADYKVRCDAAGEIRVDALAIPSIEIADVITAAKRSGFNDPDTDYTIFVDAISTYCGIATYESDAKLSPDNRSNTGGGYALAFQDCWLDETPMHESAHNQGAVQADSPNSTGSGGHCAEERDVLCYSPDGGDRNQGGAVTRCPDRVRFDCGADDYFDSSPEPGEYLASHWNLGSPLNRFIAFGQGAQPPPCPQQGCARPVEPDAPRHTATAAPPGGWAYHRFAAPRRVRRIDVGIDGPCAPRTASCEAKLALYLRPRKAPTRKRWECRSRKPGADQLCRIRGPRPGRWYAGIRTISAQPGTAFTIQVRSRR